MKIEWWYDNSFFEYGVSAELELARLTVREDGATEILTSNRALEFPNESAACLWLGDEEYAPLDLLLEDLAEKGVPVDARIRTPADDDPVLLRRHMVIPLPSAGPRSSSPPLVLDQGPLTPPISPKVR